MNSPTNKGLLNNKRLKMFRPISALPVTNFGHARYTKNMKRNLEIGGDKDYSFNDGIFSIESVKSKELKSYTSKNPRGKTASTGLSSIDPAKLQMISRQQNNKLGFGIKSSKHKKTKSNAMLNNSAEESSSIKDDFKKIGNMTNIFSDPSITNFDKQICSINESKAEESFAENILSNTNKHPDLSLDYEFINNEKEEEKANLSLRLSKETEYTRVRFKKKISNVM